MQPWIIVLIVVAVLVLFMLFLMVATRYKKCPPDKIMVIYGKVGADREGNARSAKCIHGGAAFIWPLVQAFTYLDLTPLSISVDLKSALSRQNIRIDVPSIFTVGISTEPTVMENAAERLRNLKMNEIQELAKDIIFGQLRLVIATMNIEEINTDRDKFLEAISRNVEGELKKIGLRLINVNVTDISDESGYIIALGQEAAAKAINDAKISVAEANKIGSIGEANAKMEERVRVAQADSEAIKGENLAKAEIAKARITRLIDCVNENTRRKSERYVGQVIEVLCEDYDEKKGLYLGREPLGRMGYFSAPCNCVGEFVRIRVSRANGINTSSRKILGLMLSNGIVALAGGLLSQFSGMADVNMGRGAIVIGLAAVIIGEVIFGKIFKNFALRLFSCVIGGIIYYIVIAIVLKIGLNTNDLKLFSALVVAIFLGVPYWKKQLAGKRSGKKTKQTKGETADA